MHIILARSGAADLGQHLAAETQAHDAQLRLPGLDSFRQPGRQLRDPGRVVCRGVVAAAERQRVVARQLADRRQVAFVASYDVPLDLMDREVARNGLRMACAE